MLDLLEFQIAAFGDFHRLIENEGNLSEDAIHLLPRLEIELVGVELHPVRIVDGLAGLDAQQNVVRAAIVLVACSGSRCVATARMPVRSEIFSMSGMIFRCFSSP